MGCRQYLFSAVQTRIERCAWPVVSDLCMNKAALACSASSILVSGAIQESQLMGRELEGHSVARCRYTSNHNAITSAISFTRLSKTRSRIPVGRRSRPLLALLEPAMGVTLGYYSASPAHHFPPWNLVLCDMSPNLHESAVTGLNLFMKRSTVCCGSGRA